MKAVTKMTSKRKRLNLTTSERVVIAACFYTLRISVFCSSLKCPKVKDSWSYSTSGRVT